MLDIRTIKVSEGDESLEVRLVTYDDLRKIEIVYTSPNGSQQVATYFRGLEVSVKVIKMVEPTGESNPDVITKYVPGYMKCYSTLGPKLKAQIPEEWHSFLGNYM